MCRVFVSAKLLANCSIACVGRRRVMEAGLGWTRGRGPGGICAGNWGPATSIYIYLSATVYKSKLMLINVLH